MGLGLNALEDRLLVLQERMDVLSKAFDPNQPRDKAGKWASEGRAGRWPGIMSHIDQQLTPEKYGELLQHIQDKVDSGVVPAIESVADPSVLRATQRWLDYPTKGREYPDPNAIAYGMVSGLDDYPVLGRDDGGALHIVDGHHRVFDEVKNKRSFKAYVFDVGSVLKSTAMKKVFDPNQPRNEDGEWTEAGGGSKPPAKPSTVLEHVRSAGGWVTTTRIGQAVNKVAGNAGPLAKEALSHAVATMMTYHSKSGPDYDAVQASVVVLADKMEVSAREARDHVVGVLQRLKVMRSKDDELGKAANDPVIEQIDALIKALQGMSFDEDGKVRQPVQGKANGAGGGHPSRKRLNALEDRLLGVQEAVDGLRKRSRE